VVSARPVDEYGDGNGQKLNTDGDAALNELERRSVTNGTVAEESGQTLSGRRSSQTYVIARFLQFDLEDVLDQQFIFNNQDNGDLSA
jgi:hypothetical protein